MSETFRSMGCEVVVDGATAEEAASVRALFERRDATFSRFRTGSELNRVNASPASPLLVSAEFARLVRVALGAASATSGAVTPTVGAAVVAAGYDRDLAELVPDDRPPDVAGVPPWRRVGVSGRWLTREGVVTLDLNGVVKGATVDDAVALLTGGGSVSAGGDLATTVPVDVELPGGGTIACYRGGIATSGTDRRRWLRGGVEQHHLIDPLTGRPSVSPWRCVTVAADSCVAADVAAKAALLLGAAGPSWLDRRGLAGRFVDPDGVVTTNVAWTFEAERRAGRYAA